MLVTNIRYDSTMTQKYAWGLYSYDAYFIPINDLPHHKACHLRGLVMISEGPPYRGGNIVNYELKLSQGIEVWSLILKTLPFVRTEMLEESGVPSVIKLSEAQERSLLSNCNVDDVLLSRPTHPFLLKLFREPYKPFKCLEIFFSNLCSQFKGHFKRKSCGA